MKNYLKKSIVLMTVFIVIIACTGCNDSSSEEASDTLIPTEETINDATGEEIHSDETNENSDNNEEDIDGDETDSASENGVDIDTGETELIDTDYTLEYTKRYNRHSTGVDHLLTALSVGPGRAVVGGVGLYLIDLDNLPEQGSNEHIDSLGRMNVRNLYLKDDYLFANQNGGAFGFAIVQVNGDSLLLIDQIEEDNVFFEKMDIDGNYLYVAAHDDGIRIFDISNPKATVEIGRLETGFTDAFDISVSGNRAYVADGAGGLKIVDVTNKANPFIIDGENLSTAVGTSMAVTVKDGDVYIAAGSSGLAVYHQDDILSREMISLDGFAEDMTWLGTRLAISTVSGICIIDPLDNMKIIAHEISARRSEQANLRLAMNITNIDENSLMVPNWDYVDVYTLKSKTLSTQPDINSTAQRLRFEPAGGVKKVTLTNNGAGDLVISSISSTVNSFSADYYSGTLLKGESITFNITYDGSERYGEGIVHIYSNDPDENPLPIQVFGDTKDLDPGEAAIDFTLPIYSKNPVTGVFSESTFTLSDHIGKVVWFGVYGSW